jgi:hypothetical protein
MQSISSSWRRECQGETAGPVAGVGSSPDITAGTEPARIGWTVDEFLRYMSFVIVALFHVQTSILVESRHSFMTRQSERTGITI